MAAPISPGSKPPSRFEGVGRIQSRNFKIQVTGIENVQNGDLKTLADTVADLATAKLGGEASSLTQFKIRFKKETIGDKVTFSVKHIELITSDKTTILEPEEMDSSHAASLSRPLEELATTIHTIYQRCIVVPLPEIRADRLPAETATPLLRPIAGTSATASLPPVATPDEIEITASPVSAALTPPLPPSAASDSAGVTERTTEEGASSSKGSADTVHDTSPIKLSTPAIAAGPSGSQIIRPIARPVTPTPLRSELRLEEIIKEEKATDAPRVEATSHEERITEDRRYPFHPYWEGTLRTADSFRTYARSPGFRPPYKALREEFTHPTSKQPGVGILSRWEDGSNRFDTMNASLQSLVGPTVFDKDKTPSPIQTAFRKTIDKLATTEITEPDFTSIILANTNDSLHYQATTDEIAIYERFSANDDEASRSLIDQLEHFRFEYSQDYTFYKLLENIKHVPLETIVTTPTWDVGACQMIYLRMTKKEAAEIVKSWLIDHKRGWRAGPKRTALLRIALCKLVHGAPLSIPKTTTVMVDGKEETFSYWGFFIPGIHSPPFIFGNFQEDPSQLLSSVLTLIATEQGLEPPHLDVEGHFRLKGDFEVLEKAAWEGMPNAEKDVDPQKDLSLPIPARKEQIPPLLHLLPRKDTPFSSSIEATLHYEQEVVFRYKDPDDPSKRRVYSAVKVTDATLPSEFFVNINRYPEGTLKTPPDPLPLTSTRLAIQGTPHQITSVICQANTPYPHSVNYRFEGGVWRCYSDESVTECLEADVLQLFNDPEHHPIPTVVQLQRTT